MRPEQFVERLGREKASAILRTDDQSKAALAMEAAVRGGIRIIEFTLTIPGVYELVQDFARRDDLVVGTGTVMDAEDVRRADGIVIRGTLAGTHTHGDHAVFPAQVAVPHLIE